MRKFSSVEEVLDFAISREEEAQDFYVKLAGFVEKPEMVKLLLDLVSEEMEHKSKLEAVKSGQSELDGDKIGDLGIAEKIKDIEPKSKMSYIEMLVVGMKKEEISRKLYSDLATIAQNRQIRDIFLQLAQEESGHKLRFEIEYELMTF